MGDCIRQIAFRKRLPTGPEGIQKHGTKVKSARGYPMQSPYIAIANRQAEIMMRIASEFGFTPASRTRIATPSPDEPTLFDRLADPPNRSSD
jgi:P27 family predicted phage terminase small subunit